MGTKNKPGKFDCYENAEPDEPMFILLARDKSAPFLVELWAKIREEYGDQSDIPKVDEALDCADAMKQWRKENR